MDVTANEDEQISTDEHHEKWRQKVEAWLAVCADPSGPEDASDHLRYFKTLLASSPPSVAKVFHSTQTDRRIDSLLLQNALESAAAQLLAEVPHGFMISRPVAGPAICTIVLPGLSDEFTYESSNEALAFVGALAKATIKLAHGENRPAELAKKQVRH
ncbi:hypothetical protein [Aurantiacibacter rhizosphaerae]|uniref:Uncharacterized protein n=1 Tax=Aurantiacibacter rhizosphaerae TaxID=2691582 RepID=A0A844XB37_9SPHN|nr:hypothetical protein [Aurantiacibacter rhizosphaerae]MWV27003.1 hypothetical protein [Aurantiacibacter rhizosphaerae]